MRHSDFPAILKIQEFTKTIVEVIRNATVLAIILYASNVTGSKVLFLVCLVGTTALVVYCATFVFYLFPDPGESRRGKILHLVFLATFVVFATCGFGDAGHF